MTAEGGWGSLDAWAPAVACYAIMAAAMSAYEQGMQFM
jgi:hypothetical protein